jgi:catechol 2,3-dioxygenase-like lactoylglutathione lyase family enzyme
MKTAYITGIAPCFIVHNVSTSLAFYCQMLGFEILFQEPQQDPFFAIVQRDGSMIFLKAVGVEAIPNRTRHPWAGWDAYASVPDPDSLAAEYASRNVQFAEPLQDTHDGLRGFEVKDPDGYNLFFGRPR